ncbi:hypothetical protein UJ101_01908 [Flavobacteriaceae bacterium UJ101]|nr:hypothetical protein UJ101_01908 [Flavobacteriaceae bacterium UJ101]
MKNKIQLSLLFFLITLFFVNAQVLELTGIITGTKTHHKKIHVKNAHIKAVAHLKIQALVITDPTVDPDHTSCSGCRGNTNVDFSNQNYIYVQEPLEGVSSVTMSTKKVHSIQYFDGLGRPMQNISINASPNGKDIVTPVVYDEFGRQVKDYLPYGSSQNTGAYIENTTAITGVENYYSTHYSDISPFSEKELEASPLNRVLKQAAPGEVWKKGSGHEIEFNYQTNRANEVRRFDVNLGSGYVPSLQSNNYYGAGQLYKTITKDENHGSDSGNKHTIEEFKDKEGRVVLKRTYDDTGAKLDTYYVYDIYGNLTYVLPPKLSKQSTINQELLTKLGYQYQYDERNRLVEKQLPGKAREYLVYDKQDRLVATQDGNLEKDKIWIFTKYDQFGRVLYTGKTIGSDRGNVQSRVNAKEKNNEISGSFSQDGITVPYTNSSAYPTNITELLTVNIYDHYPKNGSSSVPNSIEEQELITASTTPNLKGLNTVTYTRVLPNGGIREGWQKVYTYYDLKSRAVRIYSKNHMEGYTISDSKLDFRGKPEYTKMVHKGTSDTSEQTTITYFTYDHAERLVKTEQQDTGNGVKITLAENSYDELGQLQSKKVGNNLQEVDYKYNIRGWLTDINNVDKLEKDLFSFKIHYENVQTPDHVVSGIKPLYNGNISETFWKTANSGNTQRGYAYNYDVLNRIKNGYYLKNGQAPGFYNVTGITYDENGNIETLNRNGTSDASEVLIDQLSYVYDAGNRLLKVSDGSNNTHGFKDGNTDGNDYEYDVNGNMIVDKNKGISKIEYNFLNLPEKVFFEDGGRIEYVYDANGTKLQKRIILANNQQLTTTDYLDGYQYVDGKLEFYPHAEGYVNMKSGIPEYVYNYTDHLGNVRVSYVNEDGKAKIVEESNYYPFGLKHNGYNTVIDPIAEKYKYGYQGQELQDELDLNWSSFKWRNADPAIGRFMSIDPLAEKYTYNSPYAFSENKLGLGNELEGLELAPFKYIVDAYNNARNFVNEAYRTYNAVTSLAAKASNYEAEVKAEVDVSIGAQGGVIVDNAGGVDVNIASVDVLKVKVGAKVSTTGVENTSDISTFDLEEVKVNHSLSGAVGNGVVGVGVEVKKENVVDLSNGVIDHENKSSSYSGTAGASFGPTSISVTETTDSKTEQKTNSGKSGVGGSFNALIGVDVFLGNEVKEKE